MLYSIYLSVWFTSLNMIIFRSIHVAANGIILFFFFLRIYVPHLCPFLCSWTLRLLPGPGYCVDGSCLMEDSGRNTRKATVCWQNFPFLLVKSEEHTHMPLGAFLSQNYLVRDADSGLVHAVLGEDGSPRYHDSREGTPMRLCQHVQGKPRGHLAGWEAAWCPSSHSAEGCSNPIPVLNSRSRVTWQGEWHDISLWDELSHKTNPGPFLETWPVSFSLKGHFKKCWLMPNLAFGNELWHFKNFLRKAMDLFGSDHV